MFFTGTADMVVELEKGCAWCKFAPFFSVAATAKTALIG